MSDIEGESKPVSDLAYSPRLLHCFVAHIYIETSFPLLVMLIPPSGQVKDGSRLWHAYRSPLYIAIHTGFSNVGRDGNEY